MQLAFLKVCHAQTCGKCVPCRVGLGQLERLLEKVLDNEATMETLELIEETAENIKNSADCAIGFESARMVLAGLEGFREDYSSQITDPVSQTHLHGVAPGCYLQGYKVLDKNGNGKILDIGQAVEDIMKYNQNHAQKIRVINISVGMRERVRPELQQRLLRSVEQAWDQGIVVLAAAGNNGPGENTVTSPGVSKKIITVGSLDTICLLYTSSIEYGIEMSKKIDALTGGKEEE